MPSDWRDDKQYDHFDDLGVSGLAWECLRRNSRYRDDYELMREGGDAPADWGLRFRCKPTAQRTQRSDFLASNRSTRRRSTDRCSSGRGLDLCQSSRAHRISEDRRRRDFLGSA